MLQCRGERHRACPFVGNRQANGLECQHRHSFGLCDRSNGPIRLRICATIYMEVQPAGVVSFTGTNPWVVNRPFTGSIQVFVSASKPGRVDDYAYVAVTANPSAIIDSDFLELYFNETNANVTTVIMSSSVGNAASHPLNVTRPSLVARTAGAFPDQPQGSTPLLGHQQEQLPITFRSPLLTPAF